ncbi:hypothetical protein IQ26_07441 [Mesorhizobium tianshanense]|uniref:Uncharacterized protein n=1 Tax=Mesorhizobium tianshanense TaxID=39844 RepID=A0A562MD21_9HYPH|nr:hypothetical protein IQ26_07441 [Mesorhizobium tianshanense]
MCDDFECNILLNMHRHTLNNYIYEFAVTYLADIYRKFRYWGFFNQYFHKYVSFY